MFWALIAVGQSTIDAVSRVSGQLETNPISSVLAGSLVNSFGGGRSGARLLLSVYSPHRPSTLRFMGVTPCWILQSRLPVHNLNLDGSAKAVPVPEVICEGVYSSILVSYFVEKHMRCSF
jgi:hypothetical protein